MNQQYATDTQLATRYAVSRSTIWRWTRVLTDFPKPKRFGDNTTRWALEEIEKYEQSKSAA